MQIPQALSAHRAAAIAAALALLMAGALIVTHAAAAGAPRQAAHLVLTSRSPVTVSGRGFRPHVRVNLRLVVGRTFARSPRASATGGFAVTFPAVIDRCSGWSVSASQPGRASVMLHGPAKPACAPASTP